MSLSAGQILGSGPKSKDTTNAAVKTESCGRDSRELGGASHVTLKHIRSAPRMGSKFSAQYAIDYTRPRFLSDRINTSTRDLGLPRKTIMEATHCDKNDVPDKLLTCPISNYRGLLEVNSALHESRRREMTSFACLQRARLRLS